MTTIGQSALTALGMRIETAEGGLPITRRWLGGVLAGAVWLLSAAITGGLADVEDWERTREFLVLQAGTGTLLVALGILGTRLGKFHDRARVAGPWLVALPLFFSIWEVVTAKTGWLPLPFFVPPQGLLEAFLDDWPRLGESLVRSLILLLPGYFIGAAIGYVAGLAIGWSKVAAYWGHPILRFVGPLPATAWLPVAFFCFPSSHAASTFLIALASGFPTAVLTASGIAGVSSAYYDVARTLGATERFLILRVAIPAAMPHVFVGLFMGLGSSFAVLVVAEMMGVKAGVGWYLEWAKGWAAYSNMYAALALSAVTFSALISLLFKVRDRSLAWQTGLVRW